MNKKPFYKTWWGILLLVIGVFMLIGIVGSIVDPLPEDPASSQSSSQPQDSDFAHANETLAESLEDELNDALLHINDIKYRTVKVTQAKNPKLNLLCEEPEPSNNVWIVGFKYEREAAPGQWINVFGQFCIYKNVVYAYDQGAQELFPKYNRRPSPVSWNKSEFTKWILDGDVPPVEVTGCKPE